MWVVMVVSFLVFGFFGLKVKYEEDISKLVPSAATETSELAFGNLKVKDKIFIQIASNDESLEAEDLVDYIDEFVGGLCEADSANHYIANVLYSIDSDVTVNALDYVLEHLPSFVDTTSYVAFDLAIAGMGETMARNYETVMNDMTGSATQMVANDPLELRNAVLSSFLPESKATGEQGSQDGEQKESVAGFNLIDGHLFCPDGTVALAFIAPNFKALDSGVGTKLFSEITLEAQKFKAEHPDAEIFVHGSPIRSVGNSHRIKTDLLLTIGLSLIIILLVICISFRSIRIVWQQIVPVVYGALFSLACIYWLKGGMSLMALGIGAIVLGVALSYCLHVIIHHKFIGSPEQVLKDEATPVCLGCITTIGAFLGLLFTKSDLLRDFGLFATFALIGNTFFALVFLPHFLREGDSAKNDKVFTLIDKINSYPYDRKYWVIALVTLIVAVGVAFAPMVRFDTDLKNIGYVSKEAAAAEKLYKDKNNHGFTQRYYAVAAPTLDEALEANKTLSDSLMAMKDRGLLAQASSVVAQLFKSEAEQQARIDAWKAYWSPKKIETTVALIRSSARLHGLDPAMFAPFYALLKADYEPGDLYSSDIIPEELLSNFIEELDGKYLIFNPVLMDAENMLGVDDAVAAIPNAVVVDPFYYTNDMVRIIKDDFNVTLWISSLLVFIVLLIAFRSLSLALVAFMPMFFSWYVVQGVMAIFGIDFNLINIVISTFIFGIGVDYSIFVMQGLLSKARGGGDSLLSYHKVAIFFSAFVLVVVVVSLLFAQHPAISSIGVSTLIGMCSTIVITYTLQPFLFRRLLKVPFFKKRIVK